MVSEVISRTEATFGVKAPHPVHIVPAGGLQVAVYETAAEMGLASALAIATEQCRLVAERGTASLQLMAAPSAFCFYEAYAALARVSVELQEAIHETHFFQFDDYLLPGDHQASFRFLLTHHLFGPLSAWYDPGKVHPFEPDRGDPAEVCEAYARLLHAHGPDLMLKGQGEDGHWGFHQPGIPLDGEPRFISVAMNEMNTAQQMHDHPTLFKRPEDVPTHAFTANVPLFMRTRVLIEDNVPQASKAYAVLASYGTDAVDACCPSSALKRHFSATARTTMAAAWALLEYRERGWLSAESMARLDENWETPGNPAATAAKRHFMRESFDRLGIAHD
ncbi:MAG: 6-phosphogluconolactonase [Armatimonadetes bacterium]|nr:6-phosphogluconolactonase [Armatimonadota bacterium]